MLVRAAVEEGEDLALGGAEERDVVAALDLHRAAAAHRDLVVGLQRLWQLAPGHPEGQVQCVHPEPLVHVVVQERAEAVPNWITDHAKQFCIGVNGFVRIKFLHILKWQLAWRNQAVALVMLNMSLIIAPKSGG